MSKKNTDTKSLNFNSLIGGEIPKPNIEGETKIIKGKKKKTGPKRQTPENWVNAYVKLDPAIKKNAKKYIAANEDYTLSTLINEALKQRLRTK